MKEQLLEIKVQAQRELESIHNLSGLESFRVAYLGKKGHVTSAMKKIGLLSAQDRPEMGKLANQIKVDIVELLETARKRVESEQAEKESFIDVTLPGRRPARGHVHPISRVNKEICDIFVKMGIES